MTTRETGDFGFFCSDPAKFAPAQGLINESPLPSLAYVRSKAIDSKLRHRQM